MVSTVLDLLEYSIANFKPVVRQTEYRRKINPLTFPKAGISTKTVVMVVSGGVAVAVVVAVVVVVVVVVRGES